MGPAIFKKKIGETQYALRLFPIGGFVSMEGEDEESQDEGSFSNKRAKVVLGSVSLDELDVILAHFSQYMQKFHAPSRSKSHLYYNNRGNGKYVWKKDIVIYTNLYLYPHAK